MVDPPEILPPWAPAGGDLSRDVDQLAGVLSPLIAALTLAGYDIGAIAVSDTVSPAHLYVQTSNLGWQLLDGNLATATGQPNPPDVDAVVALHITIRRRFRPAGRVWELGEDLSMPLPSVVAPSNPGPVTGGVEWLEVSCRKLSLLELIGGCGPVAPRIGV